jgi:hypothetical protein
MFSLKSLFVEAIVSRFPILSGLPVQSLDTLNSNYRSLEGHGTFRAGRNDEKRAARADSRKSRQEMVAVIADYRRKRCLSRMSAPKRHYSLLMTAMLSDRRLRQRAQA